MHRRLGVAHHLVLEMETWCKKNGAEYSYIATEIENEASVNLFTLKLGYRKYRAPSILVQPIYGKTKSIDSRNIKIVKLSIMQAEKLYKETLGAMEFFPKDIDVILKSPLNAGTWLAYFKGKDDDDDPQTMGWAMLSLWRYDKLLKFEVRGASQRTKHLATLSRIAGKILNPWLLVPCMPNVFNNVFGIQVMYGLHVSPPITKNGDNALRNQKRAGKLLNTLCWHAHNVALQEGCKFLVTEIGSHDPWKSSIPHWKTISGVDLWCTKSLGLDSTQHKQQCPTCLDGPSLFLDPRDF